MKFCTAKIAFIENHWLSHLLILKLPIKLAKSHILAYILELERKNKRSLSEKKERGFS